MLNVTVTTIRPKFRCAVCELVNDCDCLDTTRILELLAPLARQLVVHLSTDGSVIDCEIIEQVALLLDRNDQRVREIEAMPPFGDAEDMKCDRSIVEDLVSFWGYEHSNLRTPEGIAALRKVPVAHVRGLLDRFIHDSREPQVLDVAIDETAAVSRRAA